MADDLIALARRGIAAFNAHDVEGVEALTSDDVRIIPMRAALEDVSYAGPTAVREFFTELAEEWSSLEMDLDEYTQDGDRVTARGVLRATARASGVVVEMRVISSMRVRDGLVTEIKTVPEEPVGA